MDQPDLKIMEYLAQQDSDCISFAQGALRIGGVSQEIKDYVASILQTDKADYYSHSLGLSALRERLATFLSARHSTHISFDNIFISHGSINGIAALCLLLLDEGDEVLLPEPTYPPYLNATMLAKGVAKFIPAHHLEIVNGKTRWVLDQTIVKSSVTPKTKMMIIAQPSNPCGVCLDEQELQELASWCEEKKIYLIVDEAYDNYFFDGKPVSSTPLVPHSQYLIRAGSFSKTFGMSGWRIGYIVAPQHIIAHMGAVQDGIVVCPSVIGQYAALYALEHPEISTHYTHYVLENRNIAIEALSALQSKEIFDFAIPPAGFFIFLKTKDHDTTELAYTLLHEAKVSLVPGRGFGPSGKNYLRLCYARPKQLLEKGLDRLLTYYDL